MPSSYKTHGTVTLTEKQILELHRKLRDMRHDVNGRLTNIIAAAELVRLNPQTAAERLRLLMEQPHKASEALNHFTSEFEAALGVIRP